MSEKVLKVPISARVSPELKMALENEAEELGITTSLYLEEVFESRQLENEQLKSVTEEIVDIRAQYEELREYSESQEAKIFELKKKKNGFKERYRLADEDTLRLNQTVKELDAEIQPFRNLGLTELTSDNLEELDGYFSSLEEKYPDHSRLELLLAALNRTVKNEAAIFLIHTISNYSIQSPSIQEV